MGSSMLMPWRERGSVMKMKITMLTPMINQVIHGVYFTGFGVSPIGKNMIQ
jgi:hypothetical protein